MDEPRQLVELLVVIATARLAAEAAERVRVPGVVAEISLGVVVGPFVLGLVHVGEVLRFLGEIGVILLLFEVGRQTDVSNLRSVGASSVRVAIIGVVAPMALAFPALAVLGSDPSQALFLAGALTATSVAVTARVFGDLRTLGTPTAGVVLGAAVLDDVLGLIVLTVASRAALGAAADAASLARTILPAVGFLVAAALLGHRAIPRALERLSASSRAEGTVLALGLLIALGFAGGAWVSGLTPIVGAFLAGLAVGRSKVAHELHLRLMPLGHLFIPIFFLGVGIQTNPRVFADRAVLGLTALLGAAAVVGKLIAGLGVARATADRLQVGIGMIPRGEVGLVFASVGLASGILDRRGYGALVGVVILTTLVAPWWLRERIARHRREERESLAAVHETRHEAWLRIDGRVELAARPPARLEARVALDAAAACASRRPGPQLVKWLSATDDCVDWDDDLRRALDRLLAVGNARSWRLLEMTGTLRRLLPELDSAVRRLPHDPFDLEPPGSVRLDVLEGLNELVRTDPEAGRIWERLRAKEAIRLAALARGVLSGDPDPRERARVLAGSTGADAQTVGVVGALVGDRYLLRAAAQRPGTVTEESTVELAAHLETPERADALFLLTLAEGTADGGERSRLDELCGLIKEALAHPDLSSPSAMDVVERRRAEVARLSGVEARAMLRHAPQHYLLTHDAGVVARHLRLLLPRPRAHEVRLEAEPIDSSTWTVHVAALERLGLLSAIAGALAEHGTSVERAELAVWRNGVALNVLEVAAPLDQDWGEVRNDIATRIADGRGAPPPPIDATVEFDHLASPWRTVVEMLAPDRVGLLHRVAHAFDLVGLRVHRAVVTTRHDIAVDTFWVTGRQGGKLTAAEESAFRAALDGGAAQATGSWIRRLTRR